MVPVDEVNQTSDAQRGKKVVATHHQTSRGRLVNVEGHLLNMKLFSIPILIVL